MGRTRSDCARVQAAYSGDTSIRRAIDHILLQLAKGLEGATPGPEEVLKILESHPGADRRAVVDDITYRPNER